ncbi:MAG TPA: hypothetical protein VIH84_01495 [Candidatus Methylomirabilis sp.]
MNVAQLQHHQDRGERADARDRQETPDAGIIAPPQDQFPVQPANVLVQQVEHSQAILPDRARDGGEGQGLELALALLGEQALA